MLLLLGSLLSSRVSSQETGRTGLGCTADSSAEYGGDNSGEACASVESRAAGIHPLDDRESFGSTGIGIVYLFDFVCIWRLGSNTLGSTVAHSVYSWYRQG